MNDKKILLNALSNMADKKIIVIGDMVADIYLQGTIERISREAPVLVLQQAEEKTVAGGAANVVNNIATLGGQVTAVGVLGEDRAADNLKNILGQNIKINIKGLLTSKNRATITKTRIIAGGRATVSQQVVRIDHDNRTPLGDSDEKMLLQSLRFLLSQADGIVLSDYGSGTITPAVRSFSINYANQHDIPCMVDSRYDIHSFENITYVKQNDAELACAMGMNLDSEEELYKAGFLLLKELSAKGVLVTRGEKGMVLFEDTGRVSSIPVSDKSEVYDVSGAGDTCVAAFIMAVAAGTEPAAAAQLSNYASGIAVRKIGTAAVLSSELEAVLEK